MQYNSIERQNSNNYGNTRTGGGTIEMRSKTRQDRTDMKMKPGSNDYTQYNKTSNTNLNNYDKGS